MKKRPQKSNEQECGIASSTAGLLLWARLGGLYGVGVVDVTELDRTERCSVRSVERQESADYDNAFTHAQDCERDTCR